MSANADASTASAPSSNLGIAIRRGLTDGAGVVAILYVILFALYALWDRSALTVSGVTNLSNNAAPLAIAAAGESLVVISKGFDLSVSGIVSLSNVLMATYPVEGPGGALVSLMICLGVGGAIGVLNGLLVGVLRLQSIAATLGTMIVGQGLALVIMDAPGGTIADWVSYTLTDVLFGIIPISGLIVLAVVALWLVFRRTDTCMGIFAIGADETAASLSGISVVRARFTAFVGAGLLYGLAGFMLSVQTATGNPSAGTPFLMLTFAAVALGGVSLTGALAEGAFFRRRVVVLHRHLPGRGHGGRHRVRVGHLAPRVDGGPRVTSARPSAALQPPADTRRIGRIRSETISTAAIFALTIILILASRFVSPALGSWDQVDTIITLASFLIVVAFGQGLVILVGGLDLSIASMITLGGVLATTWNGSLGSEWVVIPAVLVLCACIGALNAVGVIWLNIPPFIMTMASGIIVASAALGYTSGTPRGAAPDAFLALMKGSVGRLSAVLIFVVIFVLLAWALQSATAFGRRLYAVGANREAARIAGVATWRPIMAAYAISAVCAGFAGMMLVGYANGATLRMGDSYLLPSIASVVIGGSSILGGRGSFAGTVGGAILLTTLGTVISALGMDQGWRTVIEGAIIVGALLLLREDLIARLRNRSAR
jgi:ribose transport system permease protein